LIFPGLFLFLHSQSQTVSNIGANYHDGQIFITWTNVVNCDTGFYYVYKNSVPITDLNIQQSNYLGRVPFNFGYDFRFSVSIADGTHRFLITDDTPYTELDTTQNLFVLNCTQDGAQDYFAVRCNFNDSLSNWHVSADSNASSAAITEHLDPIKAYLQQAGVIFPGAKNGETMDAYIHYGSNITVGSYPAMINEGCLPFHFGIIKAGPVGGNNACYLKFHGGSGNFVNNALTSHINNTWKISFDDWIPAYKFDPSGFNTRWFGFNENFNLYDDDNDSPPPTTGVVRAYTYHRVKWEIAWIKNRWPNTLDSAREYLIGSSQGCAAVLINSMIDPSLYCAGNLNDPKFNVAVGEDTNPDCKYNSDGSARKESRVLWGNEDSTNFLTDIPVAAGSNQYFRIYDLTNMNFMFHYRRNIALPFLKAIDGKNDVNTCWDEKISVYDSIQTTHAGGIIYWDLREHGGGANNEWSPFDVPGMLRFNLYKSYPAFSFTSLDGNPGSDHVLNPPYYDGDNVGALHACIDWIDSSVVDSSYLWQIQLFTFQNLLNDGSYIPPVIPEVATTDVTIRRAQHFRNFPVGTKLCWLNFYHGELIQSGTVTQQYDDTDAMSITIPKVKVFQDGNILRVVRCDSLQPTGMLLPENFYQNKLNNSLIVSDESLAVNGLNELQNISVDFINYLGEKIELQQTKNILHETFSSPPNLLQAGIYFLRVKNSETSSVFKLVKI